jgi:pimeloyl-ACP methyl ester carboxylesterase
MGAKAVVVGRVANSCGQWAAQGEVVVDEQAPPRRHDHADCFGERLGFTERALETVEEVNERDIDRFGHELRLAAREETAERAAGTAGVGNDLAQSGAVDATLTEAGALKDVIEAPSLDVVRGLDARTNIGYAVEAAAASDSEPDVHEDYVSAYDLGRFAESARFVRHYPEQNPVLRDLLPTITTPTQILAGRNDDLVPWSNNQYLDDLLPNSEIHPLDAGHFAWEQAAEEYGRLVVAWVSGGYRRVAAGSLPGLAAVWDVQSETGGCGERERTPSSKRA